MTVINISSHQPKKEDGYFLDCNVLMYIFYTNGSYKQNTIKNYSELITKIINAKAKILLTDVLLSEFINTYIRLEFHRLARVNNWPRDKEYFKRTFRFSKEYKDILRELKIIITRHLAEFALMIDIPFSKFKFDTLFDKPETFDFNDRYYGFMMEKYDAYIVTNDADFSDISQCKIITGNPILLSI